jgi:hypothetical protein
MTYTSVYVVLPRASVYNDTTAVSPAYLISYRL